MYKLKEAIEKFCSDLLASQRRKCDCALAGMATWRFFSHLKVMESLLVGTGYKPLQNINYHDSCGLSYEQSGALTELVGFGMVWIGYVWMGNRSCFSAFNLVIALPLIVWHAYHIFPTTC
jgi:hypothetical protein